MCFQTGEGVWTVLESEGCCVPKEMRRILTIANYDNIILLAKLKEEVNKGLVRFVREELHTISDEQEWPQYYGLFQSKPDKFNFLPGDKKKLLIHLSFIRHMQEVGWWGQEMFK